MLLVHNIIQWESKEKENMDLNKRKHHVKKETQSDKVCTLLDEDESDEELGH